MKKLSFLFFTLLAVTLLTACNDDEESVNKQTFSSTFNCRAYDGDQVAFSQNTAKVEVNFTDMTIQVSTGYKDIDGMAHTLTTNAMQMEQRSGSVYSFHELTDLGSPSGYIDIATGMMWLTFTPELGSTNYYCTTHLLYAYATTNVTNPDNGLNYNHEKSAYMFVPDSRGETCVMSISNFTPNTVGSIEANEIQYDGLTMTPTADGYTITASEVEPTNYRASYIITDLNFTLSNQGQVINGSFKCNDLEYTVSGTLFPTD